MTATSFCDLSGMRVLITGAGRGIGPGIVEALADAGADVVVNAYTSTFVEPVAERVAERTGRRIVPVVGDATTAEGTRALAAAAVEALGGLDVLVNCLGDAIPGPLVELPASAGGAVSDDDVRRVMDLNVTGAIWASRAVAPLLVAGGGGVVVNISGAAAVRGGGGMAVYTAAKTAITGLTRALAIEWAPVGIRVNAVAPGIVPDPAVPDFFDPATEAALLPTIPARRFGRPREVGDLVRFLVSDEAAYLTGATIHLDGGLTA